MNNLTNDFARSSKADVTAIGDVAAPTAMCNTVEADQ